MYRVYDNFEKKWIKDSVYLSPDDVLVISKSSFFGHTNLFVVPQDRYIVHRDINLYDKNDILIYEGDYVKAQVNENKSVIGLVTYAHELSAYIILCAETNEYYTLGQDVCEFIEQVGNVFDGLNEVGQDGEQTLQKSKE